MRCLLLKIYTFIALCLFALLVEQGWAQQPDDDARLIRLITLLTSDDSTPSKEAFDQLALLSDPRLIHFWAVYREGSLYSWNGQAVLCRETTLDEDYNDLAPLSHPLDQRPLRGDDGKQIIVPLDQLRAVSPSRKQRKRIVVIMTMFNLSSPDPEMRLGAVKRCSQKNYIDALPQLDDLAQSDPSKKVRYGALEGALLIRLTRTSLQADPKGHLEIVQGLGKLQSRPALAKIKKLHQELTQNETLDEELIRQTESVYLKATRKIKNHQNLVKFFGYIFQGISLGSILILMALGLAITFGLMGVINMAHGEFIMLGAYATYVVQHAFMKYLPQNMFDWYYVVALPVSFLTVAGVGYLIEWLIIRHLYRRPIESLLTTWGISIILIQTCRMIFGNNIGVNSPAWLMGGVEIIRDLILPYNRCFIIILCALSVFMIQYLMRKTSIGLKIRATIQNRDMANSMGVNTRRIDGYTFAFGSGIAGMAGYGLTLVGGVTPDMGQRYIIDSFLVVVTGGVGEILGVICSGLGLGLITKLLEPLSIGSFTVEAVWAKVLVLILVMIFIQHKPAGLFPPKGRMADG
jgi:urea transport system permease protein